ncbi:alpha-E domain-containing protein, partial [Pseudomonas aeruginosa]
RSFDLAALESPLFGAAGLAAVLVGLARLLRDIAACAGQVSDRLGLRYFAHVDDVSQRTVST